MKKIAVFPYNEDTIVLIKHIEQYKRYCVSAISSFSEDEKIIQRLQKKNKSIVCNTNFNDCIQGVDIILFADVTMNRHLTGYKERVLLALNQGLVIFISEKLWLNLEIEGDFPNIHFMQNPIIEFGNFSDKKLKEINIPIISIMGIGENCNKFGLEVEVRKLLEKKGYKVLAISSNILGSLLDMEILPKFLFSEGTLSQKVIWFNFWLWLLVNKKDLDVILLGYPGGIIPLNELETNYYGEIPLILSNAVNSDVGVLSLYNMNIKNGKFYDQLIDMCKFKYNTQIKYFVMSRNYCKTENDFRVIKYYTNSTKTIGKVDEKYGTVDFKDTNGIKILVDKILNDLESNFYVL